MKWNGKGLHIGDLTSALPIVQGGMGIGVSLSGLASAVANAGGIGVISAAGTGMNEPDYHSDFIGANIRVLKEEIRKAREKTKGVLGVNIMVAMSNFAHMVKASLEEKIDVIFAGAGLPLDLPSYLSEGMRTKLVPIVSSARAAGFISKIWLKKYSYAPDAIVVEGPLAGGHLGFSPEQIGDEKFSLETIVADVVHEMKAIEEQAGKTIPVIAGGGVYTGADIHKILGLGAAGVQMATRFVTTDECDASDDFKQAYINCGQEDISLIQSPVGLPGRAIINDFLEEAGKGNKKPKACPYHCISSCKKEEAPYCISLALMNARKGKLKNGFAFAGANAWRADRIMPVQELMDILTREYNAECEMLNAECSAAEAANAKC